MTHKIFSSIFGKLKSLEEKSSNIALWPAVNKYLNNSLHTHHML